MKYVISFLMFWYDFIVGDDWRLAVGAVVGLFICGYGYDIWHLNLWWLMPLVVLASLTYSLLIAKRKN
jgi:hypothetical protein